MAQLAVVEDIALNLGPRDPVSLLVDVVEKLSAARSVEEIAVVVRSAARQLSGADGVTIVVRDGDRCRYLDEDAIEPLWKGLTFPMSACVSGWAMLNGETAIIPDIYADLRVPHDSYRPTFVKSMVMTPVRTSDPVAAIGAYWAERREPAQQEIEILQAIARVTATAFENVWLYASLKESNERRGFLIHELDHRVKNTLASVQGIARQTLRSSHPGTFVESFTARLQALSRAHEHLAKRLWKNADLKGLAVQAIAPLGERDRITVDGPDMVLNSESSVALLLGLHELAINAVKFGSLSQENGRVALSWTVDRSVEPAAFTLEWIESGGPKVAEPTTRGVGSQWIERGLSHALGGQARIAFEENGVKFRLDAHLSDRLALA